MKMRQSIVTGAICAGVVGATFAVPAVAETSVTLYGLIDAGLVYQSGKLGRDDANRASVGGGSQSHFGTGDGLESGSRWGLRGVEDLGNGTSANFVLESGFSSRDGRAQQDGRLFGRQATIGLSNDSWGRIDLGRQSNLASNYLAGIDPFAVDFVQANIGTAFSGANTVRYDNMVMYQSPVWNGFQGGAGYSFNLDSVNMPATGFQTNRSSRAVTTGLMYTGGPLQVAVTYDEQMLSPVQPKPKQAIIGAAYDFEVVKVGLAYGWGKDGTLIGQAFDLTGGSTANSAINDANGNTNGAFTLQGLKINSYMAGLTVPVGAHSSVFGSWQRAAPNKGLDNLDVYSVGYTYELSKRTNLYAFASYADGVAFVDGSKMTFVGSGIRHQF
jgi:GBP family porin